ncbi:MULTISPECIES: type VII secretion target [unclassified Streptomyces]|uniref:type VII secretion target n=1 Tax=unclassified Streptomyces TaxID=2593676 RepID=UPI000D1B743A|nr:type VII secretion target [Streptomyces sp. CB01580]
MSFENEWEQLKAAARAEHSTRMRLNQAPGGTGQDSKKKLHVTPGTLRSFAKKAEEKAAKEFREAHSVAVSKTSEVSGSMKGFTCDEAFISFIESWKKGVKYVVGAIGDEGLAANLRSSADSFTAQDIDIRNSFSGAGTYKPGDTI